MSDSAVHLKHVLTRIERVVLNLDGLHTDELKRAARFWFGTTASNKFRKFECLTALSDLFKHPERMADGLRTLPEKQRQVLAICKRYGGAVSGTLLLAEVLSRGLVSKPKPAPGIYGRPRTEDPVIDLCAKFLLIRQQYGEYSSYGRFSYFSSIYDIEYPDVVLLAGVLDHITPASPRPWVPSAPALALPAAPFRRTAAEVALDLWTTAQFLVQSRYWKTNRGGSLVKSMQKRLNKSFPRPNQDPLGIPEPEALDYEILRGLGVVQVDEDQGYLNQKALQLSLDEPSPLQAWQWVRAWMQARLWQDGIGSLSDRDSDRVSGGIKSGPLRTAREIVVWALCRVAHSSADWLDLETFLLDLWAAAGEQGLNPIGYAYSWSPGFKLAKEKQHILDQTERRRAFWLDGAGTWAANAVMGTLAHLGLVERGHTGSEQNSRFCFRLTDLGKAVFGAPELTAPEPSVDAKFLTVQPNFDVLAYLDAADISAVWPLIQMARRTSKGSGVVQTFVLTRESVYQALESGLGIEAIRRFLLEHSKTGLPDNVALSLAEWGRKREALVLRSEITLGAYPAGQGDRLSSAANAIRIGEQFVLLPKGAARGARGILVCDEGRVPYSAWRVDETGRIDVDKEADAVVLARLGQFADAVDGDWKITAASVRRARDRGIPADQILDWLHAHVENELPGILETALRNWSSPVRVFLGDLLLLQVTQPQACATVLTSARFRPLFVGHIPPDWFVVRPDKREELDSLLKELGFAPVANCKLTDLTAAISEEAEVSEATAGRSGRRTKVTKPR